jgi:hypothetical protein
MSRRTRCALLLALGLLAITLAASRDIAAGEGSQARWNAPITVGGTSLAGTATQAVDQDRRDSEAPPRTLSPRLILLAVVAALAVVCVGRRGFALVHVVLEPQSSFASPHRGRSPPLPVASIS